MFSKRKKRILLIAALVLVINISSCGKYEDGPAISLRSKKGRLVGEWEVVDIQGVGNLDGDLILEFEKEGDFTLTYDYGSYSYNQEGEWSFEDNKETIEIELEDEREDWEIKRLTNNELWFEDEDKRLWELEKQ